MAQNIQLVGMDRLQKLLVAGGSAAVKAVGKGLYNEALMAFDKSQEVVPVETGVLRSSGQVGQPEWHGESVSVEISYGGAASQYALIVHENLEAHHASGKQAKYLEEPVAKQTAGMGDRLADVVENELRGGL